MGYDPGKRCRPAVGQGIDSLEDRWLLSVIGPQPPEQPPAEIRTAGHLVPRSVAPTVNRWSWFGNTYWYVPTRNLPAVLYASTTGALAPIIDQTVFQITGYRDGYFWGFAVSSLVSGFPHWDS